MISKHLFESYIKDFLKGRPASAGMCIDKINRDYKNGKREFLLYRNPNNLVWYADNHFQLNKLYETKESDYFTITIRDLKLFQLQI